MVWAVIGVLFALLPLVHWLLRARPTPLRVPIAAALLLWFALVLSVALGLLHLQSPVELYLLYTPLAELAVLIGLRAERRFAGPRTERPRGWSRAVGIAFRTQLALVLPATPLLALLCFHEASVPAAQALPEAPPGYTTIDTGQGCGNGHHATCSRTRYLTGPAGLSTEEAAARLRPSQRCEANGWLLDRRDLCTEVSTDGTTIVYRVLLYYGL